jgi:hypothetical protein
MVEIFKTNVTEKNEAYFIIQKLHEHFRECKINFDLEDCDKILRIEGTNVEAESVLQFLSRNGYQSSILR